MSQPSLFIGMGNEGKIREYESMLSSSRCALKRMDALDPEETEPDLMGNAILKARAYAKHSGGPTVSEDSGLIIPCLGGLPGVYSARFADCLLDNLAVAEYRPSGRPRKEMDEANNERILSLLRDVRGSKHKAMFRVVLVVASPNGTILFQDSATSHGWIAENTRGTNGFGYDPIFVGEDTGGLTYAEIDPEKKNTHSHRHRVLIQFKRWIDQTFAPT